MSREQLEKEAEERISIRNSGIRISLFSTFTIIGIFVLYGYLIRPENFVFSSKIIQLISNLGMAVFVSLVSALVAIGYGVYRICISERMRTRIKIIYSDDNVGQMKRSDSNSVMFSRIVSIISQTKFLRLFILVLIAYPLI